MSDPSLERLADRTRDLLEDLDRTRQDVLAPADLNRTLRQILRNQAAILEALATDAPVSMRARDAVVAAATPQITVQAKPTNLEVESEFEAEPEPEHEHEFSLDSSELATLVGELRQAKSQGKLDTKIDTKTNGRPHSPTVRETAPEGDDALSEKRVVPKVQARVFVERFDNQDRDYEKGLAKLNRWVSAGHGGTPFQMRDDWAYLNLKGASPSGVRSYEEQLMKRMGFSRRVGRLELPGLVGEIVVYERM